MLIKVILAVIAFVLVQFLLLWTLTHLGIVLLGAAGWFVWNHWLGKSHG